MPSHYRRFPRQAVHVRASIAHPSAGFQHEIEVTDLGIAGAGVKVAKVELAPGDRVNISFLAPTLWDPLTLTARVVWSKDGRAGLAFEHKSPPSTYALLELLAALE